MDLSIYIVAALVIVAVIYYARKDDGEKKEPPVDPPLESSVTPVSPPLHKGYMSCAIIGGRLYGGTYNLNGTQELYVGQVGHFTVPATESIYQIVEDQGRVLLACEHSGGKLYEYADGQVKTIWQGGLHSTISTARVKGQHCSVSTAFNEGGIQFHNHDTGKTIQIADSHIHARKLIETPWAVLILAFNYASNVGGWFHSTDLVNWLWAGVMTGMRPLNAIVQKGRLFIAGSPYDGSRRPPATILRSRDIHDVVPVYRVYGQAMFMGLAATDDAIWASTLTNWRGTGNAEIHKVDDGPWRRIWTAPHPEIPSLAVDSQGRVFAACRNEAGGGRVYRITGEPEADGPTGPRDDRPMLPPTVLVKPKSDVAGRGLTVLLPRSEAGQYREGTAYVLSPDGHRYNVWQEFPNHHEHNRDILYWAQHWEGQNLTANWVLSWNGNAGYRFNPSVRTGS